MGKLYGKRIMKGDCLERMTRILKSEIPLDMTEQRRLYKKSFLKDQTFAIQHWNIIIIIGMHIEIN